MTRDEFTARCHEAKIADLVRNQHRYLMMRHLGVRDDEVQFDQEYGVMHTKEASDRIAPRRGALVAADVANWAAYDVVDGKIVP